MDKLSEWIEAIESLSAVDQQMEALDQVLIDEEEDLDLLRPLVLYFADRWGRQGYRLDQLAYYDKIYQVDPHDEWAYLGALTAYRLNDQPLANRWLDRWQASELTYDQQLLKSQILAASGDLNGSRSLLEDLIKKEAEAYQAYEALAYLYLDQGLYQKASFYLETLLTYFLQVEGDVRRKWRLDLMTLYLQGDAIDLSKFQALAELEDLPLVSRDEYYLMALASQYAGDFLKARTYLSKVLDLDPDALEAHLLLLEVLSQVGEAFEYQEALAHCAQLIPWYDPLIKECLVYAQASGLYPIEFLEKVAAYIDLEEDPGDHYQLLEVLVMGHLQQDQVDQASQMLEDHGEIWQETPYYDYLWGHILKAQGKVEASQVYLERAWQAGLGDSIPDFDS